MLAMLTVSTIVPAVSALHPCRALIPGLKIGMVARPCTVQQPGTGQQL